MWRVSTCAALALMLAGCGLDSLREQAEPTDPAAPTPQSSSSSAAESSPWVELTTAHFDARDCEAHWVYDQLFLWSSPMMGDSCTPQRWDPASGSWHPLAEGDAPAPQRWAAEGSSGQLVVYGQDDIGFNDAARYDPDGDRWAAVRPHELGFGVRDMRPLSTGRGVIYWGGHVMDAAGIEARRANAAIYYADTDEWMVMPEENEPALRTQHTSYWDSMHMLVFGGIDLDGNLLSDAHLWDEEGNSWEQFGGESPLSPRYAAAATFTGSHYVFFGGTSDGASYLSDGAIHYWDRVDWQPMPPAEGFAPRHPVAFWTGDHVLVLQTTDAPLVAQQYDLDEWTWSPVALRPELEDFVVVHSGWDLKENRGLIWGYHQTDMVWQAWAYEPPGDPPPPNHTNQ